MSMIGMRGGLFAAPDLVRYFDDAGELALNHIERKIACADIAGEAALRAQRELVDVDGTTRLLDSALECIGRLNLGILGGHDADRDALALRHKAQRLKVAGTGRVEFEKIAIHLKPSEQSFADRLVAA